MTNEIKMTQIFHKIQNKSVGKSFLNVISKVNTWPQDTECKKKLWHRHQCGRKGIEECENITKDRMQQNVTP
jgi:hypothetical protein